MEFTQTNAPPTWTEAGFERALNATESLLQDDLFTTELHDQLLFSAHTLIVHIHPLIMYQLPRYNAM